MNAKLIKVLVNLGTSNALLLATILRTTKNPELRAAAVRTAGLIIRSVVRWNKMVSPQTVRHFCANTVMFV
jgi:hypothetical protein